MFKKMKNGYDSHEDTYIYLKWKREYYVKKKDMVLNKKNNLFHATEFSSTFAHN